MANILVVDDDEVFRVYLGTVLRRAGHTVQEAENGQLALDLFTATPMDLVITDIFMPGMDGIDLLAALRNGPVQAKVIAISGGYKAMNPRLTLEMSKSFGAVEILTKPFDSATLLQKVDGVLRSG
ncbi:MAG: response regulator [Magnetococcales bacterium]|nr:response regulator [Magnetococcales bacterium]